MYNSLFTYSPLEGPLGCFQVLEHPHAGFRVEMFSILLDKYQGVKFLGNMVRVCLIFIRNCQTAYT